MHAYTYLNDKCTRAMNIYPHYCTLYQYSLNFISFCLLLNKLNNEMNSATLKIIM